MRVFQVYTQLTDAAAGGGPSGSPNSDPGSPNPAPSAPGAGAPGGGGDPNGGAPRFAYGEDRSRWIPPHRLEEQKSTYERQIGELRHQFDTMNGRVRALMGIDAPPDPRHEEIRNTLAQIVPGLGPLIKNPALLETLSKLTPEQAQDFVNRVQSGGFASMAGTEDALWQRHAAEMTSFAIGEYAKAVGIDPASMSSDRARRAFQINLSEFIQEDRTGARLQRYERGDRSIINEFIADVRGVWGGVPAQRQTVDDNARRAENARRLPSRGPQGGPASVSAGGEKKKMTSAEVHEAARQALLASQ
jgi:hypothetical protein